MSKWSSLSGMYAEALSSENSRKTVKALINLGGEASYKDLQERTALSGSTLVYHLNRLITLDVVESPVKGYYRLKYRTPLSYVFDDPGLSYAYFGLLGRKEDKTEPEPKVALELLSKEKISPSHVYVVTTPEALSDWSDLHLPYNWILCYEEEIVDIDAILRKTRPQLVSLLRDFVVILDCTSATKPATLAYYKHAEEFYLPLIYVYEENLTIKWLKSKEDIKKELGMD
jgi:DNA-binding transcriptional ArsR family regulator